MIFSRTAPILFRSRVNRCDGIHVGYGCLRLHHQAPTGDLDRKAHSHRVRARGQADRQYGSLSVPTSRATPKRISPGGTQARTRYCRENPEATFVPAYATGHASIYSWSCSAGNAIPGKRLSKVDHRGFRVDFWHRLDEFPRLNWTPTTIHYPVSGRV
jgi:hypothetical protein